MATRHFVKLSTIMESSRNTWQGNCHGSPRCCPQYMDRNALPHEGAACITTGLNLETRDVIPNNLSLKLAFMIRIVRRIFVILKSRNIRMKDTLPPQKPLGVQISVAASVSEVSTVPYGAVWCSRRIHGSMPLGEDLLSPHLWQDGQSVQHCLETTS